MILQSTVPPMPKKEKRMEESMFKNIRDALDKFEDIVSRKCERVTEEEEDFVRDFDLYMAAAMRKDYPGTANLGKILMIMGEQ